MKTKNIFILVFVLFQCIGYSQMNKINGLSFVAARDQLDEAYVKPVVKTNSNFVALMPFGFLRSLESPEIIHNSKRQWFGETEKGLVQYAKTFRDQNIQIMVKPQIWIRNGTYTGFIHMNSEENWLLLEKTYTSFILTYAQAAQVINADILCIGTELEKFVANRPDYWNDLIKKIRKVYKGKLTYAANWDEFKRVPFWDKIDFIGIDAYFPVSDLKTPTIEDFELGWKPHKNEIIRIQKQFNRKVLFTEYGYRSVDFNGKKPWESNRVEGNINLEAQVNGLKAIHNQFWNEDWFAGGFIWKWFLKHDKVGGDANNRFTPQNKPAEIVLAQLHKQNQNR